MEMKKLTQGKMKVATQKTSEQPLDQSLTNSDGS